MNEKEILEMTQERWKENHFVTPDGYFEHLQQRIFQKIDEQEKAERQQTEAKTVPIFKKGTRYIAVAASIMALFTLGSVYNAVVKQETANNQKATVALQTNMPSDEFDLVADYTMCDNDDIFAFLMDE